MDNTIFRAGGSKGPDARANGNGGFLKRGFYYRRNDGSFAGPFGSETQADLVRSIETTRRLHESELTASELTALRALRRKGVVAPVGLYFTLEHLESVR